MKLLLCLVSLVSVSAWTPLSTKGFSRMSTSLKYTVGIDVGTGSARCGVFDKEGKMLGCSSKAITTFQPTGMPELYEQSSENIWSSVCEATKEAVKTSGVKPAEITGIGFDATCSLVCLGEDDSPRSVDPVCGSPERNIIVWLDHRATDQAAKINSGNHKALRTVGGVISPEMEIPKLLWLKEKMSDRWLGGSAPADTQFAKFFDLPDYLVYKATGSDTRSLCTTVCKWNYNALSKKRPRWDKSFLRSIDMDDLLSNPRTIGDKVVAPGEPVGEGLLKEAAEELGLEPGTPVGAGIIDAHAGGLGVLGAMPVTKENSSSEDLNKLIGGRMALIAGTSACHMMSSQEPVFVRGVWGPYKSAMVPDMYLNEGGQSAAGKLLDHVTSTHAAFNELVEKATEAGHDVAGREGTPYAYLNEHLAAMAVKQGLAPQDIGMLTKDIHVYPDFFGNRSPLGDPTMKGAVIGLGQSSGVDELALLYLATLQSLAYQTRHIIDACQSADHTPIHTIFVTGGLVANPLYLQAHADITGCLVEIAAEPEAVLLGAAVLGARASGAFKDVPSAMKAMNKAGSTVYPYGNDMKMTKLIRYHSRKYQIFKAMIDEQKSYRELMNREYYEPKQTRRQQKHRSTSRSRSMMKGFGSKNHQDLDDESDSEDSSSDYDDWTSDSESDSDWDDDSDDFGDDSDTYSDYYSDDDYYDDDDYSLASLGRVGGRRT
jgi:FGGY-family pentulose kinase